MNVEKQIAQLESLLGRIRRNADKPRASHVPVIPARAAAEEHVPPSAMPATTRADVAATAAAAEINAAALRGTAPVAQRAAAPVTPAPAMAAPTPSPAPPEIASAPQVSAEFEELDMMDSEIVELGAENIVTEEEADLAPAAEAAPPADDLEMDFGEPVLEPIPESAPRAAAQPFAEPEELDLEPPVKTPPPESGRQFVAAVAAPVVAYQDEEPEEAELGGAADVDSLLEPDLSGGPISKAPPGMPTMEQLGDTVELEGADAPDASLELSALALPAAQEEAPLDELEMDLPKQEFSGGFDADLAPPSASAADLQRHRDDAAAKAAPAPSPFAESMVPARANMPMPGASAPIAAPVVAAPAPTAVAPVATPVAASPVVIARPPIDAPHAAEIVAAAPVKTPETFLELLDASLSLRG